MGPLWRLGLEGNVRLPSPGPGMEVLGTKEERVAVEAGRRPQWLQPALLLWLQQRLQLGQPVLLPAALKHPGLHQSWRKWYEELEEELEDHPA